MKRFTFLAVVLLCGAIVIQGMPQQPQRDPQAIKLLQRAFVAGGGTALQVVGDTVVDAMVVYTQDPDAKPVPVVLKTKGGDRLRWENGAGQATIVNRGQALYQKDGKWKAATGSSSFVRRSDHLPFLMLLNEFRRADASASYIGAAVVEGRDSHEILLSRLSTGKGEFDAKFSQDSEIRVFIDAQSLEIRKVSFSYPSSVDWRRTVPMEIVYSDYRVVRGLSVPFLHSVMLGGNKIVEVRLTSFNANVGLGDAEFEGRQ